MAVKISDLAEQLGVSPKDLRVKLKDLGFPVKALARSVEDDAAEAVKKALAVSEAEKSEPVKTETAPKVAEVVDDILAPEKDHSEETAEIYGEIVAEQLEREIVKQQRKKMAGQPPVHKSGKSENAQQGPKTGVVEIPDVISVKEFSEKIGIGPVRVIGELMKNGILANINQQIDFDTAAIVASDLHVQIKRRRTDLLVEDALVGNLKAIMKQDDPEDLVTRPPIVVVMGHVDHGKTTLLDSIRSANVASGESGGITQHIAAYQVEKNGRKITFLDTPGHEAFTAMRARGAKVTDVAVLVVAADEGIMPQTIEAIHHAQEAQVPIIVAMNKIDKPHLQMDRVKGQLAEHGLNPEEWGGTTPVVPVSALTGQGIPELLEM
ncbi:MAG: translation initiation factor IF-2 N-terminal domain-containing protein, partial [Patescibacteria group bacterium]